MDQKIGRLLVFYDHHGRWPKWDEIDSETGYIVGKLLKTFKQQIVAVTEEQRDRLLSKDPRVLDIKPISYAARTMTKDQKIDRLVAFYDHRGRWPKWDEIDFETGYNVGRLLNHLKHRFSMLTSVQRDRLLSKDQNVLDIKPVGYAAKTMTMDQKLDRLTASYDHHGRWPKQDEIDFETGLRVGILLDNLKQQHAALTEVQRDRLLAKDLHVLDIKPISHAAKTMTMDQKIDRLIAFYHLHSRRWPMLKEIDAETGLRVGNLLNILRHQNVALAEEQRCRLLAVDPHVLDIKPISHAAKTMTMDQKIDRLIAFYHLHDRRWPKEDEIDAETGYKVEWDDS